MEKEKIKASGVEVLKIELNESGDYVSVSADNPVFFDKFVAGFKRITELADTAPAKIEAIEKKYEGKEDFESVMDKAGEMSGVNVELSRESAGVIDGIFGEGTTRKYFRNIYEEIPDFLPDANGILDFFEQMTPPIERLFNRKVERQKADSKARMAKYQPLDHKRPSRKSTAKKA